MDFDALWDYSQPGETEARFRALLPQAEASGDVSYLAQLLTQIGRAQGLQGNFEGASHTLDRVDGLGVHDIPVARIRSLLERGRVLNSSGKRKDSVQYFLEAWALAREYGEDFYAVDAAHMLGIVEPPAEQLSWSTRARELAESSDEPRARTWLGPIYNNLGWTYHDLGQFEEALELFQRSLEWRREQGQSAETRIAAWTVARCLRSLGRFEEALAMQEDNLRRAQEAQAPDGFIEEEIGECLLALGRPVDAQPYFARAHELLSGDAWLGQHERSRLERLEKLGQG